MSRRLLLALAGSCALLTSQALVRGQYPAPSCPPGYPAYPYAPMMPQNYPPPGGYYYPPPTYQQAPAFPGTTPMPAAPTPAMPAPFMPGPMNQFPSAPLPTPQPAPGNVPRPSPPGNFPPSMNRTPSPAPAPGNSVPSAPTPSPAPGNTAPSAPTPSAPANSPPSTAAPSTSAPSSPNTPPVFQPGADSPGAGAGMGDGAGRGGDESADVGRRGTSSPPALPMLGDFFGVRYRHAVMLPITRTINYSLFNPSATSATTVSLAPVRSGGVQLATTVSSASVGTQAVPAGQVTNVTLAPGGNAVVTATGVVPTAASFVDYAASRGAIKISDFDSPRPRDRFYVGGWYYNNIPDNLRVVPGTTRTTFDGPIQSTSPEVVSSLVGNAGTFFDASQVDQFNAAFQRNSAQLVREVAGFEKTLELGGIDGSFGMRLPMYQFISDDSFKDIGDLSLIWKAVVCGGFDTEDLVTIGLVLTLPTGQKLITPQGDVKSVLIQPWMGYYYTLKNCYLQGFTGVVIPSDSKDTGFSYTSMALGYRLYDSPKANPLISLVAVQGELYATTPFDHPNPDKVVLVNNFFVTNVAMHVGFGDHSLLTVGCGTPFGGYRPFDFEASAVLNLYF